MKLEYKHQLEQTVNKELENFPFLLFPHLFDSVTLQIQFIHA